MPQSTRLSGEERRAAIVEAVIPLFAKKGFHGVTTKALAEAAGVSEALLYKHFPSKESLYEEIQTRSCAVPDDDPLFAQIRSAPASTEKLVFMVSVLLHRIAVEQELALPRLMAASLLEDGQFARMFLRNFRDQWFPVFLEALRAAREAGDLTGAPVDETLGLWFCQHLAASLLFVRMPGRASIEYGVSREKLVEHAARFCLRGLGLTEEALRRHLDSASLGEKPR